MSWFDSFPDEDNSEEGSSFFVLRRAEALPMPREEFYAKLRRSGSEEWRIQALRAADEREQEAFESEALAEIAALVSGGAV